MLLALALIACKSPCADGFARASDGLCYPIATGQGGGPDDTGDTGEVVPTKEFEFGDAITEINRGIFTEGFYEITDAEPFDETQDIFIGQGGALLMDRATGEVNEYWEGPRLLRVDADNGLAVGAGSHEAMLLPGFRRIGTGILTRAEDAAIHGNLIGVAARDQGVLLFNRDGGELGSIPATDAWSVAIQSERALVSDDGELVLWDLADPENPVELDRIGVASIVKDIDWQGDVAAVALGAWGAQMIDVGPDSLTRGANVAMPGTVMNLSLEPGGEWLWMASWEATGLAWVGAGGPVVVGHESPDESAMAITAVDGVASLGDWMQRATLERTGLASGELHIPGLHRFDVFMVDANASEHTMPIENRGAFPLTVSIEVEGATVTPAELVVDPGSSGSFTIQGTLNGGKIVVTSDDPDEANVELLVQSRPEGLGSTHPEIELQGFVWPDSELNLYRSTQGQVYFLAYWLSW